MKTLLPGTIMAMPTVEKLYSNFRPQSYALEIIPDLEKLTFSAKAIITGALTKPSNVIKLHAHNLKISTVEVRQKNNLQSATFVKVDKKNEQIKLRFKTKLTKTPLEL